jgi:isoleucyl-tRNA synthetase
MEYKSTLLMPNTEFEMRGNLSKKEPDFQLRWEKLDLYAQMQLKREGAPGFVLHDGPPYANGRIHIGHALNKILKDVVVRSHFMAGYRTPFTPGWDTHGLPIETAIQKEGVNRKTMSVAEFRKKCEAYALNQVNIQMSDMKALGTVADYDKPYITLNKSYEAHQIRVFAKMAMDGLIYKGLKPVYWSPSSESALAEAEIEYHDKKSPSIYVSFDVVDGKGVLKAGDKLVIWTTTPWTIPANLAISLNPQFEYALVSTEKGRLLVLKEFVDGLMKEFKLEQYEVVSVFEGKELEFVLTQHPLYPEKTSVVLLGSHVSNDAGTGCVHTAPGHGVDDFTIGSKYGLEAYCPVDEQGKMMESAGDWLQGVFVEDANKLVVERLDQNGALLGFGWITHSYPHDWRTKKPVIYRATTQWFASIEKIREQLLSEIDRVNWVTGWGKLRMHNMIKDRGDWCISRQRAWGVPIPIFYAQDGTPIMEQRVFDHVAALFEEFGSHVWFEREAKDLLPDGYTHLNSPEGEFKKETDIMDVWFDSGSSHTSAMQAYGQGYPADVYLEGSDQYRGWFNSSLIIGTAFHGQSPYRAVVSHGFVLDGKGEKMSKSSGNVVDPNKVTSTLGADILRLWTMSIDYQADVRISDDILKQVTENYRKIRNTFRFMLGNIHPEEFTSADLLDVTQLTSVDLYVLDQVNQTLALGLKSYREFDYVTFVSKATTLLTNTLSAYYLDFTKDILYIEKKDSLRRRQVQTVIYLALDGLVRMFAPMLVHTAEEVWDFLHPGSESVHLQTFAPGWDLPFSDADRADWALLMELREDVFKSLEEARALKTIGKSLEAEVILDLSDEQSALVEKHIGVDRLAQWLIVSKVTLDKADTRYEVCGVNVVLASGHTCPRCWNVTESAAEDHLCDRCGGVLNN